MLIPIIPALIVGAIAWAVTLGRRRPSPAVSAFIGFLTAMIGGTLGNYVGGAHGGLVFTVIPSAIYLWWVPRISKAETDKTPTAAQQRPNPSPKTPVQQAQDQIGGTTRTPLESDVVTEAERSKSGIFISYRREDKRDFARVLYERLARNIDEQQIFMDVDSIELGLDFVEAINQRLAHCSLMLVVIGNEWLDCLDSSGRRRLDNPDDFVRLELETALARPDVRVIPILVDGAKAPASTDLPESLRPLARRNALIMTHENFGADFGRLYGVVQKIVLS
jgi:TIR domain